MKMSKKQNIIFSILFVCFIVICTVSITVFAKNINESYALGVSITRANITNGSDVVSIQTNSSSGGVAGFYVGTSNNVHNATYYPANGKSSINVSLLNGTYYLWVRASNGAITKYNNQMGSAI